MTGITLYYNKDCPRCRRQAKRTAKLDWLRRVKLSTEESPLGEVPLGEIVVVDKQSNRVYTGIFATRRVCMQVPAFFVYGLLLYIPFIRKLAGKNKPGCNGDACKV